MPCPGYEKSLKWSTKYEKWTDGSEQALPAVSVGFQQALAALVPEQKKQTETTQASDVHLGDVPHPDQAVALPMGQATDLNGLPIDRGPIDVTHLSESAPLLDLGELPLFLPELLQPLDLPMEIADLPDISDLPELTAPPSREDLAFDDFVSSAAQVASLSATCAGDSPSWLRDYYALPSPGSLSLPEESSSRLVDYYFDKICIVFSAFDSDCNPFRANVARIFQHSSTIYYAIQSMAAAQLGNSRSDMAATGVALYQKACRCLQDEMQLVNSGQVTVERMMLAILLLGLSTSWHDSGNLGEDHLVTARRLILPKLLTSADDAQVQRQNQFFEEALIYWEMLMGFVSHETIESSAIPVPKGGSIPQPLGRDGPRRPACQTTDGKIIPHPWTGIAPRVQTLFAQVGRLVRRHRMAHRSGIVDMPQLKDHLESAGGLEEELLKANPPSADEVADPGDEKTPNHDFVVLANVYRLAGLLQLYRVFPGILQKRLSASCDGWPATMAFSFPTPRFRTAFEAADTQLWICALAVHMLSSLKALPSWSGTCCLQPILLVTAASELRVVANVDHCTLFAHAATVRSERGFVEHRLDEFAVRLPAKPIRRMQDIVREVWRRFDAGLDGTFWMDVMLDNGWHTIMG